MQQLVERSVAVASTRISRWVPAAILAGVGVLALGTLGALRGREPFATWYYVFAWYGTLLALDGVLALAGGAAGERSEERRPTFLLLGRPAHLGTLLFWSAVFWLLFELLNLRLRNWYYVFVPGDLVARRAGVTLSFATVLPAILMAETALARLGAFGGRTTAPLRVTPRLLGGLQYTGGAMLVLALLWPRWFFPLVWGAVTLLLDPHNYRRAPARSLLGDLERGRPGRPLRLLVSGALVGLVWELFNSVARGQWIYTVPGFDELKLFEMPVVGFLGFPPFALECFAFWQMLVLHGLAVPRWGRVRAAPAWVRATAAAGAVLFSGLVLAGIDRWTVSSETPRLSELPGAPAARLAAAGYDVFTLARAHASELAARAGLPAEQAAGLVAAARVATLRGIGTENTRRLRSVSIESVEQLAQADAETVAARLGESAARVKVWVRAARAARARAPLS